MTLVRKARPISMLSGPALPTKHQPTKARRCSAHHPCGSVCAESLVQFGQLLAAGQLHLACSIPVAPSEGPVLSHPFVLAALVGALIHVRFNLQQQQQRQIATSAGMSGHWSRIDPDPALILAALVHWYTHARLNLQQ